jgi:hypothetical protein
MEIFAVQPNDVRLLNDFTPSGALRFRLFPTEEYALYLYEVAPLAMQERTP